MGTRIENNSYSSVEDYATYLQKDLQDEVNSKKALYDEIHSVGTSLLDLTRGKEHKEINKTLKTVQTRWNGVLDELQKRRNRVQTLIEVSILSVYRSTVRMWINIFGYFANFVLDFRLSGNLTSRALIVSSV